MPEYIYGKLKTTGEIISIKDIPNDKAQRDSWACVCPKCGVDLIPKKGEVRVHHFAHERAIGCNATSANETALHQMAKEIIKEERKICIPQKVIFQNDLNLKLPHYIAKKLPEYYLIQSESVLDCEDVRIEERVSDFRPDVVVVSCGKTYFIEIWKSHKTDDDKLKKVEKYGLYPMLEIDIHSYIETLISKDEMREFIVSESHSRKWIYYPNESELYEQARVYFESFEIVKNYRIESAKKQEEAEQRKKEAAERVEREKGEQAEQEKIRREEAEKLAKKRKEEQEQARKVYLEKQRIVEELFQPEVYKKLLFSYRGVNYTKKIFEKFLFYKKEQKIPFFINIPITGEIIFQCDRRVWQASIFNNWIYCRDKNRPINLFRIFKGLHSYIIPIDKRLSETHFYIPNEMIASWIPYRVIKIYMGYLQFLGFIKIRQGKWADVIECSSIVPPNKERTDKLEEIVKSLGDHKYDVDVDKLIQAELDVYLTEERKKKAELRLLLQEEKKSLQNENKTQKYFYKYDYTENGGYDEHGFLWVKCNSCKSLIPLFNWASFVNDNEYLVEQCPNCTKTKE